jgi:hypothetical protein
MRCDAWYGWTHGHGELEISHREIEFKSVVFGSLALGMRPFVHTDQSVPIFATWIFGVMSGCSMLLNDGERHILSSPATSQAKLEVVLRDSGFTVEHVEAPFPRVLRGFAGPLVLRRLKALDYQPPIVSDPHPELVADLAADWILEFAAGGGCPLSDIPGVVAQLYSIDEVAADRQAKEAIAKLESMRLVRVSGTVVEATARGLEVNDERSGTRASDFLILR